MEFYLLTNKFYEKYSNSKEILKNVEMVSDDLKLSSGICGASSGNIPVTIGQATIKISEILVGGSDE